MAFSSLVFGILYFFTSTLPSHFSERPERITLLNSAKRKQERTYGDTESLSKSSPYGKPSDIDDNRGLETTPQRGNSLLAE